MPTLTTTDQSNTVPSTDSGFTGQGINSPAFDTNARTPKPRNRSIRDAQQAAEVFRTLAASSDTRERNQKNARIMAKYNSERPYRVRDLETEGLSWKANFSTKVLATLVDRVAPRFTRVLASLKHFTSSKLPDSVPNAAQKTERFRDEITKLVRRWPEWRNFIAQVAQENALFGYTCAAWTSEYTWRPKHFRQDNFYVPGGTKQDSGTAQIVCLQEAILPHELFEFVSDADAADAAGWNVPNTLAAINSAMPEKMRSPHSDYARVYEDMARESNVAASYLGAKVVLLGHVFAQEVDGKVSHYIVDTRTNDELFTRVDRFDSMRDACVFFSFQEANGNLHGSKGIGREVYAIAGVLDRARNEVVDRLQLAGKVILQADEKMLHRFRLHISGPAMLIGSNYQVAKEKVDGNVEPFFALDEYMTRLLDQIAGNVSPKQLEGERVTAAQVNVVASREEESKDAIIERFLDQFSVLISQIQRRACSPECQDDDAKAMRNRLLKHMSPEELAELAETPSAEVVKDLTEFQNQQVILVATEHQADPLFNQYELRRRKLTAQLGSDFADAVLLPVNDPTEEAEQARLQQLELLALERGQPVPTSPRDNHLVHLQLLQPIAEAQVAVLASNAEARPFLDAILNHMQEHIKAATESGDPKQNPSAFAAFVQDTRVRLQQLDAHDQAAMQAAQAGLPPEMAINAGAMGAQAVPVPTEVVEEVPAA